MDNKPCPFCGSVEISVTMPTSYRWLAATCLACGCIAPEVRINTMRTLPGEAYGPEDVDNAMQEWNRRAHGN